jgi:hypothetical protein
MASSRTGHRRGATPATLSPHPKPALSLEEWEARAPLGDLEIKSVNALKLAAEKAPLPLKVLVLATALSQIRISLFFRQVQHR